MLIRRNRDPVVGWLSGAFPLRQIYQSRCAACAMTWNRETTGADRKYGSDEIHNVAVSHLFCALARPCDRSRPVFRTWDRCLRSWALRTKIDLRRWIAGSDPDGVDPQLVKVTHLRRDAVQIADPVVIAVANCGGRFQKGWRVATTGGLAHQPVSSVRQQDSQRTPPIETTQRKALARKQACALSIGTTCFAPTFGIQFASHAFVPVLIRLSRTQTSPSER